MILRLEYEKLSETVFSVIKSQNMPFEKFRISTPSLTLQRQRFFFHLEHIFYRSYVLVYEDEEEKQTIK